MWIVTKKINDYNQHGVYFISAYNNKPTIEELTLLMYSREEAEYLINGGVRKDNEDVWYNLIEVKNGEDYEL